MPEITPSIPLDLGGKTRQLRFDINAAVTYERTMGKSIRHILDQADPSDEERLTLVWCCLLTEEEGLTRKQVGTWLTSYDQLNEAYRLAVRAVLASVPARKEEPAGPPPRSRWTGWLCGLWRAMTSALRSRTSGGSPSGN